jgi:hypothetical protein
MTDSTKYNISVSAKADSIIFSPLHCRVGSSDMKNMQNEPNLSNTHRQKMQNKPNFTTDAPTDHANGVNFTTNFSLHLLQKDAKKRALLLRNTQKTRTFSNLFSIFHITFAHFALPIPPILPTFTLKIPNTNQNKPNTNQKQTQYHFVHLAKRATK